MIERVLERVVSGGQTGVDRAALDAAMNSGLIIGGWCPKGRLAEDGSIPDHYPLTETFSESYEERTRWNVQSAGATLILFIDQLHGGTKLTYELAKEMEKPVLCCDLSRKVNVRGIRSWIVINQVRDLNVAGPRESSHPGIYQLAQNLLRQVFL